MKNDYSNLIDRSGLYKNQKFNKIIILKNISKIFLPTNTFKFIQIKIIK